MYPVFRILVLVSLIVIKPCSCTTITRVWTVMGEHAFKSLVVTILLKRSYGTAVKRRWKCSSEIWEHVDMTASHFLQICQLRSHAANYHFYHSSQGFFFFVCVGFFFSEFRCSLREALFCQMLENGHDQHQYSDNPFQLFIDWY